MKQLISLVFVAALAGCATHPVAMDMATPVPLDRIYAFQAPKTAEDGRVVVVRDSGFLGGGCRAIIYIDDKEAATVARSETVALYISPGEHLFSAGPTSRGLCGLGDAKSSLRQTITITVKPNHTQSFRLAILGGGGMTIMPTSL